MRRRPHPCVLPRIRMRDRLLPRDLACERRQVAQRAAIDAALEGHHVLQRVPEVHPAPEVELGLVGGVQAQVAFGAGELQQRSEEHTSELQSLMRISYAVICLIKKKYNNNKHT